MIDWDAAVLAPAMSVFGQPVLYRPARGRPFRIEDGVYDSNYSRSELTPDGVQVTASFPVLGVRAAAVHAQQGDRLTILETGETYAVAEVIADGHGHVLLRLNTADAIR